MKYHIDTHKLKAGAMDSELITEYSTLALTMLANAGFMYEEINQLQYVFRHRIWRE